VLEDEVAIVAARIAMEKLVMVKMSPRATARVLPRPLARLNSPMRRLE